MRLSLVYKEVPSVFQNAGLALLTILIPLAITILADIFQKRDDHALGFVQLDLMVILEEVFQIKWLIGYALLVFVPFAFWGRLLPVDDVLLVLSGYGLLLLIAVILRIYQWLRGQVHKLRMDFLSREHPIEELVKSWQSVWNAKSIPDPEELEFMKLFSSKVRRLLNGSQQDFSTVTSLIDHFGQCMPNRSPSTVFYGNGIFSQLVEWIFGVWSRRAALARSQTVGREIGALDHLYGRMMSVFVQITKLGLDGRWIYSFFNILSNHLNTHIDDSETQDRFYYIGPLIRRFMAVLFTTPNRYMGEDLLDDAFPQEWRITKSNWDQERNRISKYIFAEFHRWMANRLIQSGQIAKDDELDHMMMLLFPHVNLIIWSDILIFSVAADSPNKVRNALSLTKTFGSSTSFGDTLYGTDNLNATTIAASQLALSVFPELFSTDNLRRFMLELQRTHFEEGSYKELRLRNLRVAFGNMQDLLSGLTASP